MNPKLILVPTDFSPTAGAALDYAALLARNLNARLLITHVHAVPELPGADGDVYDPGEQEERRALESIQPTEAFTPFSHLYLVGHPSDVILRAAREHHADIIVMGAHGQTNSPDNLTGSVVGNVLRHSACPVLTIHLPVQAAIAK